MKMADEIMEAINNFECFRGAIHPFSKEYPEYKKIEQICHEWLKIAFCGGWNKHQEIIEASGKYKTSYYYLIWEKKLEEVKK